MWVVAYTKGGNPLTAFDGEQELFEKLVKPLPPGSHLTVSHIAEITIWH